MKTLSIAICEDSPDDRERLESVIRSSGMECACEWFESGEAFLESFTCGKYDLIFLDVYMAGMTGVDVAQDIREIDRDVMLAFVTTSPDFAMEGYRNRVERYLLKPYKDSDIIDVLEDAAHRMKASDERVLSVGGEEIPHSRIRYVEQRNHTTIIYLVGGQDVRRTGRLDDVENELPSPPFYRCHKSYLVNLDQVMKIDRDLNTFEMEGGGSAYIRRASVRDAQRAFEARLIERTKALGKR